MKNHKPHNNTCPTTATAMTTMACRRTVAKSRTRLLLFGLAVLTFIVMYMKPALVHAETTDSTMPGMEHSQMDMGETKQDAKSMDMKNMDHSKMDMGGSKEGAEKESGMAAMNHADMQMQGGDAPADARDPHAYAGGQTLTSGDYALPGPRILKMADEHNFYAILFDRLERVDNPGTDSTAYDMMAWFGRDYNRLVIKSEGDFVSGKLEESSTEVLWSHAFASYWDAQLGMRYDSATDLPNRSWLAAGVQGLAPYWFEIDATAYVGNDNRTALALKAEYELLITQKLVLQPAIETNLYGKDDPAVDIGKGLSDVRAGIRLRYEIKREFAPYIGVEYTSKYGKTADMARAAGADVSDTRLVAGLRFWY